MELERARILERERALEQERLERERALEAKRIERERMEREKALELERLEKERLEQERLEREAALERERLERERERMEREKASEQERIERERIEQLRALEKERLERERALAQERIERERALEQERIERESALEQQRIERARELERFEREKALEQERLEQERIKREKALEQERLEQERIKREEAREQERIEQERIERERSLELERIEREKALELERIEREKAEEQEQIERERALEREKIEKEKALEREKIELEKALERERVEKERIDRERIERERALKLEQREQALEQQRLELEKQENERIEKKRALEQERIQREKAIEQKEKAEGEATLERERLEKAEQERLELEKAQEVKRQVLQEESRAKKKALELEKLRLAGEVSVEKKQPVQKENAAHDRANESRMADVKSEDQIGFVPLPTPPPLSTGTSRKTSTEAGKQQGEVHGPVTCERQAEESNTPNSPQPVLKKFRFSRETPLQPQAASRVIKRPRAFSDTPQPCASVMSATIADGQRQKEQSIGLEADAGQFVPDVNQVKAVESAKKKEATNVLSESKEELDENEAAVKKRSILTDVEDQVVDPSSPVGASGRGRNVKKTEKKDLRRSLSNDSSESDSASSSSPSTDSSSSLREKTYTSRQSRDKENALPQSIGAAKVQKTGSTELEISSANAQINEGLLTKLNEASSRDDLQTRKRSEDDEDKPENSCDGESSVSKPEKSTEANNETHKAFSTRKISLGSSKSSPGSTENEHDLGTAGGRKRRWGSSTAVTAKKPSISITTDSLKSLIPDIKPALNQEEVMELHPEEPVLSETEEEEKDHADQELQIRRTVTQIVHVENQVDGHKDAKRRREESEEEDALEEKETKISEDLTCTQAIESPSPSDTCPDADIPSVAQSDILIRRSISQQKTGVSITIDDPVRTARQPSPPRGNVSNIVHVCNLVRPFTLGQLKELLSRTGTLVEDGFWIDKIKSHCYVTYSSTGEAVATREALHGVKWPQSNPKVLSVDFCQQDELDFHKGLGPGDRPGIGMQSHGRSLPSLLPERDQWVEREREMERRERARAEREWDRDKVREFGKAPEQKEAGARRSRSRERRRKEREKSKEKKTEKKEKTEDPPAKLLDDLFRKTKAVPCIYWLPLTEEQYLQREAARVERRKEREMQRKKEEEAELKKKEENKERMKPGGVLTVDRSESEKIRDRDRARDRGREREREADKRRDGYRRPGVGAAPSGRRSRSRSDPRERRR
uniref:Apoptotic chromatin condensation inducer 1a n=1 Tax=Neogobius melanostomus TaxID=47308 RepID=A0A8C6UGM9_9GOBI